MHERWLTNRPGRCLLGSAVVATALLCGTAVASRDWRVDDATLAAEAARQGEDSPWREAPLFTYVVPAISSVRRLPDSVPTDGVRDHHIPVIGARGEYIPASFVIAPLADVVALEFTVSALDPVGADAASRQTIAAAAVDLKIVKCLWKPGTAWSSYFADPTRRELTPELLLNDDTLVKVDLENQENYLRVDYPDGPEYVWISYHYPQGAPQFANSRHPVLPGGTALNHFQEPIADSPVLLPLALHRGRLQQFWLTLKAPETAAPGRYDGRITVTADGMTLGDLKVNLRVLPFTLPDPRTYHDLERPFIASMDNPGYWTSTVQGFNGDRKMAEARLRNWYANQRAHNLYNFNGPNLLSLNRHFVERNVSTVMAEETLRAEFRKQLELIRDAGFTAPLIAPARADISAARYDTTPAELAAYIEGVERMLDLIESVLGYREVFFWGRGEPNRAGMLEQLEGFRALHAVGVKMGQEAKPWHFAIAGYAEDLVNIGGQLMDRETTAPWRALGHRVTSYANPHPGTENPDRSRRVHGMQLYKAWFDGTKNNTWISERQGWLDFWNPYSYRIKMIYPTQTGVIDTLAWEGFREGIDDVRYATLLKQLAEQVIAEGDVDAVYAAKRALVWLELHDEVNADLNTMRLEMINRILQLMTVASHGILECGNVGKA